MKKEKYLWGLKPSPIITTILKYKKPCKVLDIGSGEGRNSIFLAKKGFAVTAVDISKEGARKLKKLASKEKVKINSFVEDIRYFEFKDNYDIIISTVTLHFLKKEDSKKIIKKMKSYTNKNGLNVITLFTEENSEKNFPYLFKKGELKEFYNDWKIISCKEYIGHLEDHGGKEKPHRHGISELIAQKH